MLRRRTISTPKMGFGTLKTVVLQKSGCRSKRDDIGWICHRNRDGGQFGPAGCNIEPQLRPTSAGSGTKTVLVGLATDWKCDHDLAQDGGIHYERVLERPQNGATT